MSELARRRARVTHRCRKEISAALVTPAWQRAVYRNRELPEGSDIATNRRDEQELSMPCLRILQAALIHINTHMLQDVLADPDWSEAQAGHRRPRPAQEGLDAALAAALRCST
jgi:TnpA family transposase